MSLSKFYKKTLKNGMVVLFEKRNSSVVSVSFAVRYGGINESKEEKGISHFIEHMLYKGTKNRTSRQISEEIEKNGGILNGFTEEELTAYWCKMPSKKINIALEVLSDMVKNPLFDEFEINKERQVIFEEMKMRRDTPHTYIYDKIQSLLYEGNLALDSIGTEQSLNSIDKEKLLRKFNRIYGSENMILCVVGDTNFKKLCKFCERNFKKSGFKIPEPFVGLRYEERVEKRKGIDQANFIFAYHSSQAQDSKAYAAQVLSCLMGGGMSSRLWQEIREKRNLAYAVKSGYSTGKRFGYTAVYAGTSPGNLKKVRELIIEEFKKIETLNERELNQVKEQLIGNSKISKEDSQGQMLDLLYNEVWGDAGNSYKYESRIKKVNLKDVKKLANLDGYSSFALIPER